MSSRVLSRDGLVAAAVTPDRWGDLVALFERPGPRGGTPMPGSCWCMWWRERSGSAAVNKAAMQRIVEDGPPPGLLAYRDGEPVGWVSVAPRDGYGQLLRAREIRPEPDDTTNPFVITCFYADRRERGSDLGRFLAEAAVAWAKRRRAPAVEAYPMCDKPDYMGSAELFEELGFVAQRDTGKRTVMRLALTGD